MNALRLPIRFCLRVFVSVIALAWASARAQPIYSANILGYVDADFVAGSNLIANPLFALDNTISNLLRNVPNGSSFIPWDRAAHQFGPTNQRTAGSWSAPLNTLVAPDGGFLVLPAATRVSFVGQTWRSVPGPGCVNYPIGESLFGWFPASCCGLDCDLIGVPPVTEGTTVSKWNRVTQAFVEATYYDGFGWIPSDPSPFALDESALFHVENAFDARSPFLAGLQDVPVPTHVPSATMIQPQRTGTNFTFSWASASNMSYAVFCSTNLHVVNWRLVDRGTATPSNGVCTVTFGSTHPYAFCRLQPDWGGSWSPVLLAGRRSSSSNFSFQFYAPTGTTYTVERALSPVNPTWFTVTNLSAGPSNIVAVVDASATDPVRYYRVRY